MLNFICMLRTKTRKTHKVHNRKPYPVVLNQDVLGGFWAMCPSLQGCYSQGETIEETLTNIKEAILLCLEDTPKKSTGTDQVSLHFIEV